jgi:hypothetical protein
VKDCYELWFMSRHFEFEGSTLAAAVGATFERRGMVIRGRPVRSPGHLNWPPRQLAESGQRRTVARSGGVPDSESILSARHLGGAWGSTVHSGDHAAPEGDMRLSTSISCVSKQANSVLHRGNGDNSGVSLRDGIRPSSTQLRRLTVPE